MAEILLPQLQSSALSCVVINENILMKLSNSGKLQILPFSSFMFVEIHIYPDAIYTSWLFSFPLSPEFSQLIVSLQSLNTCYRLRPWAFHAKFLSGDCHNHKAMSHHLNQCWQSSMMPYAITKPQWVNSSLQFIDGLDKLGWTQSEIDNQLCANNCILIGYLGFALRKNCHQHSCIVHSEALLSFV